MNFQLAIDKPVLKNQKLKSNCPYHFRFLLITWKVRVPIVWKRFTYANSFFILDKPKSSRIFYSKEFLLKCKSLGSSNEKPKDWEIITRRFPQLIKVTLTHLILFSLSLYFVVATKIQHICRKMKNAKKGPNQSHISLFSL